jgi:signal transduction histidine kinase
VRRRLLASTLTIVVAILVLFGVPLGIVVDHAVHADARSRLETEATRVARELGRAATAGAPRPTPQDLDQHVAAGDRVLVVYPDGVIIQNRGRIEDAMEASAPAPGGALVRVSSPSNAVEDRVQRALLALVVLGVAALSAAIGLALIQSRRLSDPLARLARSATRLGDGDFSLATPRSGVPEIDAIASSLDRSAERVEQLLKAERGFSEHASHQLRTALTGLQLRLEELAEHDDPAVREEAEAALVQSARLLSTIEELLALARTGRAGNVVRFDLGDLVRQHVDDVEPILTREGRRAIVDAPAPVEVVATLGAVGQALDILLSNAVRHGGGAVTATVASDERRARVDIADEGPGFATIDDGLFQERVDTDGHGIGLALARTLVTTEGGTITLVRAAPPVFRIELPLG